MKIGTLRRIWGTRTSPRPSAISRRRRRRARASTSTSRSLNSLFFHLLDLLKSFLFFYLRILVFLTISISSSSFGDLTMTFSTFSPFRHFLSSLSSIFSNRIINNSSKKRQSFQMTIFQRAVAIYLSVSWARRRRPRSTSRARASRPSRTPSSSANSLLVPHIF